jgi:hypothetical protein
VGTGDGSLFSESFFSPFLCPFVMCSCVLHLFFSTPYLWFG